MNQNISFHLFHPIVLSTWLGLYFCVSLIFLLLLTSYIRIRDWLLTFLLLTWSFRSLLPSRNFHRITLFHPILLNTSWSELRFDNISSSSFLHLIYPIGILSTQKMISLLRHHDHLTLIYLNYWLRVWFLFFVIQSFDRYFHLICSIVILSLIIIYYWIRLFNVSNQSHWSGLLSSLISPHHQIIP